MNGTDVVSAAAAQIAAHAFADFLVAKLDALKRIGRHGAGQTLLELLEHFDGRTNLARRAVAALKAVVFDERRLQRVQFAIVGQAFDGGDFAPLILHGQSETGIDALAVHQHGARAARALIAAFFAGQFGKFAQRVEQRHARLDVQIERLPVDA